MHLTGVQRDGSRLFNRFLSHLAFHRKDYILLETLQRWASECDFYIHRQFYITGVLHVLTEPEGHLVSYSILCPLGLGVLRASKKLKRITVLI